MASEHEEGEIRLHRHDWEPDTGTNRPKCKICETDWLQWLEQERIANEQVIGNLWRDNNERWEAGRANFERVRELEQQLATLTTKLLPEHEAVVKEVAAMRLELEQITVQKTLLSGSLQEKEQQLDQARALLERTEHLLDPHASHLRPLSEQLQLLLDTRAFLAPKGE